VTNLRTYGGPPFRVAVVHGGPGAGGEMAPVARRLAAARGVLEPIQTATSLAGQIEELRTVLQSRGQPPVTLVGFSWGAWLGYLVAARHPRLVGKLLLVGSGPFEAGYVSRLEATRLARLTDEERDEYRRIVRTLTGPATGGTGTLVKRLGALAAKADQLEPVPEEEEPLHSAEDQAAIFAGVWPEAAELRKSGRLLECGRHIRCPVVAIHGDYDPHPAEGVREPLSRVLPDFRFILLKNCGHKPWVERQASDEFYRLLQDELGSASAVCD
jgi:pimeloyl-ACP methyl ester carboxylesterase